MISHPQKRGALQAAWPRARLGEIVSIKYGKMLPTKELSAAGFPVFGANGIIGFHTRYLYDEEQVLISCRGAYSGKINLSPRQCYVTNNSLVLELPSQPKVTKRFLFYGLQSVDRTKMVTGSAQPQVTINNAEVLEIPIPPLGEQDRIVAEIEKQFTRLDAGVMALRRVQTNLKRYRAAVLKAACEGKLVPTEAELSRKNGTPDFESGALLLERILAERRKNWTGRGKYQEPVAPDTANLPSLPDGWTYASVETVGSVQLGRQRAPKHHKGENMRPYLRVANVFEDRIDLSDVMEMNFTPSEFETFRLKTNDILLNEGQSLELVGRPAIYKGQLPGVCFTNTLVRFRPSVSLDVKFALSVFRAFMHAGRFQKIAKWTTNIAHLGSDRFAKMAFPIPPLAEQKRIVADVERRLSVLEELESAVSANLQRANRLRQSILQKAFLGKIFAAPR